MNNRTWIFAVITSGLLVAFCFAAMAIGLPGSGFGALAFGLLLLTTYQALSSKFKRVQPPLLITRQVKRNA